MTIPSRQSRTIALYCEGRKLVDGPEHERVDVAALVSDWHLGREWWELDARAEYQQAFDDPDPFLKVRPDIARSLAVSTRRAIVSCPSCRSSSTIGDTLGAGYRTRAERQQEIGQPALAAARAARSKRLYAALSLWANSGASCISLGGLGLMIEKSQSM